MNGEPSGCPGYTAVRYRREIRRWMIVSAGAPRRLHQVAGRENAATSL